MTLHSDSESDFDYSRDFDQPSSESGAMDFANTLPNIIIDGKGHTLIDLNQTTAADVSDDAASSQYIRFAWSGSGTSDADQDPTDDDSHMDAADMFNRDSDIGGQVVDDNDGDEDEEDGDEEFEGNDSESGHIGMKNVLGSYLLAPMGFDDDESMGTAPGMEGYVEAAERFQIFAGVNEFDESDQIGLNDHPYQVVPKSKRKDQERILENKRRQGKLLLVSLLDNFCLLYDQSPERNRKLFYVICKTLSNMGIIDEEYLEEMSAVRSSYQRAFRSLVVSALTSIKQEQMIQESRRIMAPPSTPTETRERRRRGADMTSRDSSQSISDSISSKGIVPSAYLHTPQVTSSAFPSATAMMRTLSFGDMFDNDPTRYKHDFVEICKLGKGGFASVFKARNKLDGIEYAIKKIRLRGGAKVRYEKIFREIKFLARLDHKNVVRYYSSWLEHADYPVSRREMIGHGPVGDMDSTNADLEDEYDDEYGDEDDYTNTNTMSMREDVIFPEKLRRRRSIDYFGPHAEQHGTDPEDLSMGIVFGEDDDDDRDSAEIDFEDVSHGLSDMDNQHESAGRHKSGLEGVERLAEGEDMERTHSASSTLTSRVIPGTKAEAPRRKHKSPTVSQEMQGKTLAWEEPEDESARTRGSFSTSYSALSSSIEEIQRSLPSSYSNSGLGSRYGPSLPEDRTLDTLEIEHEIRPFSFPDQLESLKRDFAGGGMGGLHGMGSVRSDGGRKNVRISAGRLITRDLTLFIQMQLCQTTLQDYLVYRNERPAAVPKRLHDELNKKLCKERHGISAGSSFADQKVHSAPGSPLQPTCHKDLVDPAANQHIFRAIVEGVAYIHDQDMIHRDLKPSNIFLGMSAGTEYPRSQQQPMNSTQSNALISPLRQSLASQYFSVDFDGQNPLTKEQEQEELFMNIEMMVPKIGDFGLVTDMEGGATLDDESSPQNTSGRSREGSSTPGSEPPLLRRHSSAVTTGSQSSRTRTTAVGTVTYASPEQLARPNLGYDQKADIYSLGIIFFELYHPFSTLMERHAVLRTLRQGELPPDFVSRWPKEAAFVLWLMAEDPRMRPTAREILDFDLIHKPKEEFPTIPTTPSPSPLLTSMRGLFSTATDDYRPKKIERTTEHTKDLGGGDRHGRSAGDDALLESGSPSVIMPDHPVGLTRVICEGCQSRCRCFLGPLKDEGAKSSTLTDEDLQEDADPASKSINSCCVEPSKPLSDEKSKRHQHHRSHHRSTKSTSSSSLASKASRSDLEQRLTEEREKVRWLEMSMAAIRAENRALMDRIQQLEYEKELSWRETTDCPTEDI
ncbi:Eukaryotic translation initiation factor 2-alpha kinase [Mortierella sp. GBA30]|nr:Eukaryotic translation initiation factor 2-alpha kinase [Mortierella sp. GBA30]